MTLPETYTPAEVGAALKEKSADWVERRVNTNGFEHLRVGRSMRFTREQAESFILAFRSRDGGEAGLAAGEDPLRSQSTRSRNRGRAS